jgi:hypothetical protein
LTREPLKPVLAYSSLIVVVAAAERDGCVGLSVTSKVEIDPGEFIGREADQVVAIKQEGRAHGTTTLAFDVLHMILCSVLSVFGWKKNNRLTGGGTALVAPSPCSRGQLPADFHFSLAAALQNSSRITLALAVTV